MSSPLRRREGMAERYVVVGGGLAGLMTVIKLAEAGKHVDVFSIVPVKRSHSVCAQGGINGAVNTKGEGDHPDIHVKDTLKGGDFLAEQPPVKGMCYAAPQIIYLLDRMGVPFNRTSEGLLDFRRFGGTLHHRTAFAGASTGQQLLYALDEQVRRYEHDGLVRKFEYWEYLSFIRDEQGACRGIVALDLRTMEIQAFPADAVCLATGGPGIVYGRSTNSTINTGSANGRSYMDGAVYANAEFVQVHPTAIPGEDKHRLMSESARGEGGRVWVPKQKGDKRRGKDIPENERWYFLEEKYPRYGNLVPRDVGSREIFAVVKDLGMGVEGQDAVYLDVSHIPAAILDRKLGGIMDIYEKFQGVDPRHEPMKIFPAVHYSMGGLWCDYEADAKNDMVAGSPRQQMTNIPGLYAAGECDYAYLGVALGEIQGLKESWKRCNVLDTGRTVNRSAAYVNQLWNMLEIAHLILKASRLRDESRGSHYKPEFVLPKPKTAKPTDDPGFMAAWKARNDRWLRNSMGTWTPEGPRVEFQELQSLKNPILAPEPRHYD